MNVSWLDLALFAGALIGFAVSKTVRVLVIEVFGHPFTNSTIRWDNEGEMHVERSKRVVHF